ncbi:hypothetical protein E5163_04895 [Marinicauda algicola]|uniref:DUF1080 domain-containing protein n=1 Tax=Marinicauda algicola TaxID=2029849 RepID=A0A4V3RYI5_9PROT|nr:hypothetical protein [Marinicauda algicola]TGY90459.1 hypothetical protein E5163_04895 [Marinicauda algicola]
MKITIAALAVALAAAGASAQEAGLGFQGRSWGAEAQYTRLVEFQGREGLQWRDGQLWLDAGFRTGEIEFDLVLVGEPGHTGIIWHAAGDADYETFYLRHHLSGQPDSVQYAPSFSGNVGWQIYADRAHQDRVNHRLHDWMRVRLVIDEDRADVYLDGERVFHIPHLHRDAETGPIGFWNLAPDDTASAIVANLDIRPGEAAIRGEAPPLPDALAAPGLVTHWQVSAPFAEAALPAGDAPADFLAGRDWTPLDVEPNGIANLARAADVREGDTVLARHVLTSAEPRTVMAEFGYSDRARVYLNGALLYAGNKGWATRDYRYLGTVTRHQSLPLRLREGENELVFAVSETFGGWAVTAAIGED